MVYDFVIVVLLFFFLDIGFEVPDAFLVGYALDYNEYFRDLSVSLTTSAVSSLKIYIYNYGLLTYHSYFSFEILPELY